MIIFFSLFLQLILHDSYTIPTMTHTRFLQTPPESHFLTDGAWEVERIVHFDDKSNSLFYISNERNPRTRHLYRIRLANLNQEDDDDAGVVGGGYGGKPEQRHCMTCNDNEVLKNCTYFDADISPSTERIFVRCLGE